MSEDEAVPTVCKQKLENALNEIPTTVFDGVDLLVHISEFCKKTARIVRQYVACSHDGSYHYLTFDETKGGIYVDKNNMGHATTLWPSSFEFNVTLETPCKNFPVKVTELQHPVRTAMKFSAIAKRIKVTGKWAEVIRCVASHYGIPNPTVVPYNPLLTANRFINNSFVPPFMDITHPDEIQERDLMREFCTDANSIFDLMYEHIFRSTEDGYSEEICYAQFIFFWRFMSIRLRYPSQFKLPELWFWFSGRQGSGKNNLMRLIEKLFGSSYVSTATSIKDRFDGYHYFFSKVFVVCNEFDQKGVNQTIKRMTDENQFFEKKGESAFKAKNFASMIFLSNADQDIKIIPGMDLDDRRGQIYNGRGALTKDGKREYARVLNLDSYPFIDCLRAFISLGSTDVLDGMMAIQSPHMNLWMAFHGDAFETTPDDLKKQYSKWAGSRAKFNPAKMKMILATAPPSHRWLYEWLDSGVVPITAGFKDLPQFILESEDFWGPTGSWLRLIPLGVIHPTFTAYTGQRTSTQGINWSEQIKMFMCPESELVESLTFDQFLSIPHDAWPVCAVITGASQKYILIPPLPKCREMFIKKNKWATHIFPPAFVPKDEEPDHYSHHLVRMTKGMTISQNRDEYNRVRSLTDADDLRSSYPIETKFRHLQFSRVFAPLKLAMGRTADMTRNFLKLLYDQVAKEHDLFTTGSSPYDHLRVEAANRIAMKRTRSYGESSQEGPPVPLPPSESASTPIPDWHGFTDD